MASARRLLIKFALIELVRFNRVREEVGALYLVFVPSHNPVKKAQGARAWLGDPVHVLVRGDLVASRASRSLSRMSMALES